MRQEVSRAWAFFPLLSIKFYDETDMREMVLHDTHTLIILSQEESSDSDS